jgi:hypothetical protein
MTLYIATMNTGSFDFMTAGATEDEARKVMRKAWKIHARECQASYTWSDVADGVNFVAVEPGSALRDGSPMSLGTSRKS